MTIEYKWDKASWDAFVNRIQKNLSWITIDKVLEATAYKGLKSFVSAMPKRTGALKRSWYVLKHAPGEYLIASDSKVALFLEKGTKAHGPKTAKFLYIPLRPGAAVWRKGFVLGKDYLLAKRVKGIDGLKYLAPTSKKVHNTMVDDFMKQLEKI